MKNVKNTVLNATWKMRMFGVKCMTKKDSGESHVITVIAMCVIGVALVLVLSGVMKPMITTMCSTMQEKISSMFSGL